MWSGCLCQVFECRSPENCGTRPGLKQYSGTARGRHGNGPCKWSRKRNGRRLVPVAKNACADRQKVHKRKARAAAQRKRKLTTHCMGSGQVSRSTQAQSSAHSLGRRTHRDRRQRAGRSAWYARREKQSGQKAIVDPLAQTLHGAMSSAQQHQTPPTASAPTASAPTASAPIASAAITLATPPRIRTQYVKYSAPQSPDFDTTLDVTAILGTKKLQQPIHYHISRESQPKPFWARARDLVPRWDNLIKDFLTHGATATSAKSAKTSDSHRTASRAQAKPKRMKQCQLFRKQHYEHLKSNQPSSTAPVSTSTALPSSENTTSMPASLAAPDQKEEHAEDGLPRFPKLPKRPSSNGGPKKRPKFIRDVNQAFDVIAKWRKNVFRLPSGSAGKHFTQAKAEMYAAYGEKSPMECIALKAAAIMAPLLLQQPAEARLSRQRQASRTQTRAVASRQHQRVAQGGMSDPNQLENSTKSSQRHCIVQEVCHLGVQQQSERSHVAADQPSERRSGMPLNDKTKNEMASKHPSAEPAHPEALLSGPVPPSLHPVFYDALNGELIKKCTLRTKGSAGVSQQEDNLWHKMVTGHKEGNSAQICNAVASVARRLATEYVNPEGLEALLANRGIALNNNPGLRPVGVGEMVRRIIGKAVMSVTGEQVQKSRERSSTVCRPASGSEVSHSRHAWFPGRRRKRRHSAD